VWLDRPWRALVRRERWTALTPDAPADRVHGPQQLDAAAVHLVLDLALRVGEVQLASGAGAADVTATIVAVTSSYGLPHTEVDVTYTSITASCHRGTELAPVTSLRVVRTRGLDLTRLSDVEKLIRRVTAGAVDSQEAYAELDRITTAPHPYPRWVATLAWAGMAAAVAFLVGGGVLLALTAAGITAVIDRVGRLLNRRALPFFFQQIVGGALATGAALVLYATDLLPSVRPSLVVAAGIVVLLSGLSLVSSVQDAITGYNVTAAGRTMEIVLLTAGLISGVALALRTGVRFGVVTSIAEPLPPLISGLPKQFAAGAATSAFFALASYAKPRALIVAAGAGAIGTTTYGVLTLAGFDVITASALAATLVGFGGAVTSRRLRVPTLVVGVSGLTPLLPGWTTYRGLYQLTAEGDTAGLSTLVLASGIALALAGGVVLGEYFAHPVRTGLSRLERRLSATRAAGRNGRDQRL
jgi:uncharacterized membrane protein YjjP (DUF1212 family)